jgi:hypothetical protein
MDRVGPSHQARAARTRKRHLVSATVRIRHYHSCCAAFAALEATYFNLEMTSAPSNGGRARMYATAKFALHHWKPSETTLVSMDGLVPHRDSWPGRSSFESQLLARLSAVISCNCPDAGCEVLSTVLEPFMDARCFAYNQVRELLGRPRDERAQNLTVASRGHEDRLTVRGAERIAPRGRHRTVGLSRGSPQARRRGLCGALPALLAEHASRASRGATGNRELIASRARLAGPHGTYAVR